VLAQKVVVLFVRSKMVSVPFGACLFQLSFFCSAFLCGFLERRMVLIFIVDNSSVVFVGQRLLLHSDCYSIPSNFLFFYVRFLCLESKNVKKNNEKKSVPPHKEKV